MNVWAVSLEVEQAVTLPGGEELDRDAFYGWLWGEMGGLLGICEGTVEAAEAAALGLVESPRVLDAAAAPADRDWVRGLTVAAVSCWFGDEPAARAAAARLAGTRGCRVLAIRHEDGQDDESWKRGFGPIDVPGFGTIRPAWEEGEPRATVGGSTVFIDPGAGFGTGLHETTRLCLAALGAWTDRGGAVSRVLDFGSGSGILGIAAAVRGAGHVDAVESDERVHDAIRANARRNGVADRIQVHSTLFGNGKPYDLVLANIVADVLLAAADELCRHVRHDGAAAARGLVLSGLLAEDVPRVVDRYGREFRDPPICTTLGDWQCLHFTRAGGSAS